MILDTHQHNRRALTKVKRVVVKVGSNVLINKSGDPKHVRLNALVNDIARLHQSGIEVVLVSSGAVSAGLKALKIETRPKHLPDLQMAASIGQTRLLSEYSRAFTRHNMLSSQVLLTYADLNDRERHLNARHTLLNLLRHQVVPIINENDVVAVDELRFGDNDKLSALVSVLVDADLLVMLTTPRGLLQTDPESQITSRIPYLEKVRPQTFELVQNKTDEFSTGGMQTKLQAAQLANQVGALCVIASGFVDHILHSIVGGNNVGTLIGNRLTEVNKVKPKKRWIAHFHKAQGTLMVDDGAVTAMVKQGKSLLPSGISQVDGKFQVGAVVKVHNLKGKLIAKGLVDYNSEDIALIAGKRTDQIQGILGRHEYDTIIHRDNLSIER